MREREDIEWIRRKNLDGVATLVTDLTPGYSTAKQNPHICNHPLMAALREAWSF